MPKKLINNLFIQLSISVLSTSSYCQGPGFDCSHTAYLFQQNPTAMFGIELYSGDDSLYNDTLFPQAPNNLLNAFGYNITDNKIWGYRYNSNEIVRVAANFQVDTVIEIVGLPPAEYNVGDIDNNGIYYLYRSSQPTFLRIDLNPNSASYLTLLPNTSIALHSISDWAVSPISGHLYSVSATGALIEVNPNGGSSSLGIVSGGNILQAAPFGAAYMDSVGTLYVGSNNGGEIFSIPNPHLGNTVASLYSIGPSSWANDGAKCNLSSANPTHVSNSLLGPSNVSIGPNPFFNHITVESKLEKITSIEIYDVAGRRMIATTPYQRKTSVDVSELPSGVYSIMLDLASGINCSRRLIK